MMKEDVDKLMDKYNLSEVLGGLADFCGRMAGGRRLHDKYCIEARQFDVMQQQLKALEQLNYVFSKMNGDR
jgi:hypothetical protein